MKKTRLSLVAVAVTCLYAMDGMSWHVDWTFGEEGNSRCSDAIGHANILEKKGDKQTGYGAKQAKRLCFKCVDEALSRKGNYFEYMLSDCSKCCKAAGWPALENIKINKGAYNYGTYK